MSHVAVHLPEAAKWHALCNRAEVQARQMLDQEVENYLVALMLRCFNQDGSLSYVLAPEQLNIGFSTLPEDPVELQTIADQCLIITGLIPEWADRFSLPVSQFLKLGRLVYAELARKNVEGPFASLSRDFVSLIEVMQTLREQQDGKPCMTPLQAHDVWMTSGSIHALNILQVSQHSVPVVENPEQLH